MIHSYNKDSGLYSLVELDELARFSVKIGSNPLLIQGAGGNTSIKIDNTLWVKASGIHLSTALDRHIFVPLNLNGIRKRLNAGENEVTQGEILNNTHTDNLRPSIETSLHALMPHKIVLHVHSVNAIAFAIQSNGKTSLTKILDGFRWGWVPYARPGVPLTRNVEVAIKERPDIDILVLANHGIMVGSGSIDEAESLLTEIESRINLVPREIHKLNENELKRISLNTNYKIPASSNIQALAIDSISLAAATTRSLYPDHVVFLGPGPIPTINKKEISNWLNKNITNEKIYPVIIIPDLGVLIHKNTSESIEEMVVCLADILLRVQSIENLVFLSEAQERELINWDAEKYRQTLNNI